MIFLEAALLGAVFLFHAKGAKGLRKGRKEKSLCGLCVAFTLLPLREIGFTHPKPKFARLLPELAQLLPKLAKV